MLCYLPVLLPPLSLLQIHIRGGSVVPMQQPAVTNTESRKNNFSLLVALDDAGCAAGDLFLDDGISISITKFVINSPQLNQLVHDVWRQFILLVSHSCRYTLVSFIVTSGRLSSTVSGNVRGRGGEEG